MQDRISLYPGRVKLTPVSGQDNVYDMTRQDNPITEGTPLNKSTLLTDEVAEMLGLDPATATPSQAINAVAGKATDKKLSLTLLAANWTGDAAPYSYALTVSGVTATSNQEILPALNITAEQLETLQGANIQDGGQAANSMTLKAYGDKPTIDLPIRVIKRGD